MNQPNRADRFVLPEGERKLSYERDTKVENAGTFVLQREDHTLGNVLRMCVWREAREGMEFNASVVDASNRGGVVRARAERERGSGRARERFGTRARRSGKAGSART